MFRFRLSIKLRANCGIEHEYNRANTQTHQPVHIASPRIACLGPAEPFAGGIHNGVEGEFQRLRNASSVFATQIAMLRLVRQMKVSRRAHEEASSTVC
jgi:hypothetical protein